MLRRLEFHYVSKHASWLNMVEIEIGVLRGQLPGRQIVATQRDAEQESDTRPIPITDARATLDEVQLKTAHLVGRCRVGRSFEPSGKPLAAIDVAALRVRVELAGQAYLRSYKRSGVTVLVLLMESSVLSEVCNTSILTTGLSTDYSVLST